MCVACQEFIQYCDETLPQDDGAFMELTEAPSHLVATQPTMAPALPPVLASCLDRPSSFPQVLLEIGEESQFGEEDPLERAMREQ